jgi:hypothetical protein
MRPQELQRLGDGGHGRGRGLDEGLDILEGRLVEVGVGLEQALDEHVELVLELLVLLAQLLLLLLGVILVLWLLLGGVRSFFGWFVIGLWGGRRGFLLVRHFGSCGEARTAPAWCFGRSSPWRGYGRRWLVGWWCRAGQAR